MKKYLIVIEDKAIDDIQQITDWYNIVLKGLGTKFQNHIIRQIRSLSKFPQRNAVKYNNIRFLILVKFPHVAHYWIDDNETSVKVVSIFHTSRNPDIWLEANTE
jgi:plasmid stabilization system protein ParE